MIIGAPLIRIMSVETVGEAVWLAILHPAVSSNLWKIAQAVLVAIHKRLAISL